MDSPLVMKFGVSIAEIGEAAYAAAYEDGYRCRHVVSTTFTKPKVDRNNVRL